MSSFTDPLEVIQVGARWRTLRPIRYHAGTEDSAEVYAIPEGFLTDFASIPRPLWSLVGHPAGRYAQAAVLHDWLYATAPVPRARADGLLLEAMGVLGVRWSQRWAIYLGVRLGGWMAWAGHRRRGEPLDI